MAPCPSRCLELDCAKFSRNERLKTSLPICALERIDASTLHCLVLVLVLALGTVFDDATDVRDGRDARIQQERNAPRVRADFPFLRSLRSGIS